MPVVAPFRRRAARLIAALAVCGLTLASEPLAHAQEPTGGTVVLGSRILGFGETVPFRGNQDEVTITLPVSPGLTPTSIDGVLDLPGNVGRAWIDVSSGGRTLTRIDLPGAPAANAPVSIPLTGTEVIEQSVAVTLRITLVPLDNICQQDWRGRSANLRDVRVVYRGAPTNPSAIADFLPPILEQVHLYIPGDPTATESAAAVDLGGAVVAYYGARPVRVDVRRLPDGDLTPAVSTGPFERSILIRESAIAAVALTPIPGGPPALQITGDERTLFNQTRLITSTVADIAVDSRATSGSMDRPPILGPTSTTLQDLGESAFSLGATTHGRVEVAAGLDQTRLGRTSENIRVHLQGSYTPLPAAQNGLITVAAGDRQLDSWAAEPSGQIDRWIDIPNDALQRVTTLTVALTTTGATNQCGLEQPLTLTIDPRSEVLSDPAGSPQPGGFQALPQALLPSVDVAGTVGGFDDTARAVAVVTGLQSLTSVTLDPRWVSIDEALTSAVPVILVAADGNLPDSVELPLERTEDVTLELTDPSTDGSTTVTFGAPIDFASLQTTFDGTRQLVVAGSTGVPGELDRTLRWLQEDPDRWAGLNGDILFTSAGRDPIELSLPATMPGDESSTLSEILRWVLTIAGVLLVLGLVIAVIVVLRRRRTTESPR
ncbi:MAG: hypothetical protein WAW17_04600 [Rhodococcus sp. (in: high G+C Gram-positive bacteria)]|uniref:hypothetical protein n=1 Tax=Rhodococcus sp. TaxID=1831 RepID=UPI003BB200AD